MCRSVSLAMITAAAVGSLTLAVSLTSRPSIAGIEFGSATLAAFMNRLSGDTLNRLTANNAGQTVIISPAGLGSALHLLSFGAAGPAAHSLRERLLPLPGVSVGNQALALVELRRSLLSANGEKLKLRMASSVFVPKSAKPSASFIAAALGVFDASVKALDFRSPDALEKINGWASAASDGLVPSVVEQLDPGARFLLANVVYFNAMWETAFDAEKTLKAPFMRADGSSHDVNMMNAVVSAEFAELGVLHAVWLPYDGNRFKMLVVAPREGQKPTSVLEVLKRRPLDDLVAAALPARAITVQVRLPRFRVETNSDVTRVLSSQGFGPALSANSNYSPINAVKGNRLLVLHRAVLEVTEAGTKAAATTTVTSDRSIDEPPVLSADRPFAIAIVDRDTGSILFGGYIADPGE
jgi:serpin B